MKYKEYPVLLLLRSFINIIRNFIVKILDLFRYCHKIKFLSQSALYF